jgi:hypothetical protein
MAEQGDSGAAIHLILGVFGRLIYPSTGPLLQSTSPPLVSDRGGPTGPNPIIKIHAAKPVQAEPLDSDARG